MPKAQTVVISKLQRALECEGELVCINTTQFYSVDKHKAVTKYHIKKQIPDSENRFKSSMVELFSSCSQIQIALFLRDYLYEVQGKPVPTDNQMWNEAKARYFEEKS